MRFKIKTLVAGNYKTVLARFDQQLLEALKPPGIKMEAVRFDGSHLGNVVHIRLHLLPGIQQDWVVHITEEESTPTQAWFTDEGTQLPSFLSSWKHRHLVENHGEDAQIVDDITYRTPFIVLDYLMFPVMYLQFLWRKPIYKKIFGKPAT